MSLATLISFSANSTSLYLNLRLSPDISILPGTVCFWLSLPSCMSGADYSKLLTVDDFVQKLYSKHIVARKRLFIHRNGIDL